MLAGVGRRCEPIQKAARDDPEERRSVASLQKCILVMVSDLVREKM
jgi:hypothetical protein